MNPKNSDINILIVDDEFLIRKSVREVLEDEGYKVQEAGDSKECLKILASQHIDVALMDIQMPGLDGMETFKKMVREN